jgi:hypothetical protein
MAKKRHYAEEREGRMGRRSEHGSEAQMAKHGEHYKERGKIGGNAMMPRHPKTMIDDDYNAPANLPQHVMEKYWPVSHNYNMGYIDDLFTGANNQIREDYSDMGREEEPKKY